MSVAVENWARQRLEVISETPPEIVCVCPKCRSLKLWVNTRKKMFICYKCSFSGRIEKLVQFIEGCSWTEARERVKAPPARNLQELRDMLDGLRPLREEVEVDQPLPSEFRPCFDGRDFYVPAYLEDPLPKGRGLEDETLQKHGLGFCLSGKFRNRIIIPVLCGGNRTFLGRLMGNPKDFSWISKVSGEVVEPPKYRSPKGSNLGSFLYWIDNVRSRKPLVIVEGTLDAMRLNSLGIEAVANFGKRMTDAQIALLRKKKPTSITFLYDGSALTEAKTDAFRVFREIPRSNVSVAALPEKEDPDSFGYKHGRRKVEQVLSESERITDPFQGLMSMLGEIEYKHQRVRHRTR